MSAQFVAHACAIRAPKVVAASSGNAGVSLAAYAGAAGIPCEIVGTASMSNSWRQPIELMGAALTTFADPLARWRYVKDKVERDGWISATNFLDPPVGSHPCGVDAYKTIAFELAEDPRLDGIDAILVPTARGDLLWGIYAGFQELRAEGSRLEMPRLIAVEPFPRIARVLAGEDYRSQFDKTTPLTSIAGTTVTFQAISAVSRSNGLAVWTPSGQVVSDQALLAKHGLYVENSAAAPLAALRCMLAQGTPRLRRVIMIATSHGFKGV